MTLFLELSFLLLTLLLPSFLTYSLSSPAGPSDTSGNTLGIDYGYICTPYAANNIDPVIARRMIKQFCTTHTVGWSYTVNETLGGQNLTPPVYIYDIGMWMTFDPDNYLPAEDSYNTSNQSPLNGTCRTDAENCEQRFNDAILGCKSLHARTCRADMNKTTGQYDSHDFYGSQYVADNCGGWQLIVVNCTEEQQVPCNSTKGISNGTKIGGWCGPLSYPGIYEDKCTGLQAGECGGDKFGCG